MSFLSKSVLIVPLFLTACIEGGSTSTSLSSSSQSSGSTLQLSRLELVDAEGGMITTVGSNSTIDLSELPETFNIKVIPENVDATGSIDIQVTGCAALNRYENDAPFTIEEDRRGFEGLDLGSCNITVTPYEEDDLNGNKGAALSVSFDVVDSALFEPVPDLTAFELIDSTGAVIQTLNNNDIIDLNGFTSAFNISVLSSDPSNTGSVNISMNGCVSTSHYENNPPYIAQRSGSELDTLPLGLCTVTAVPYQRDDLEGSSGDPLSIVFDVINTTPVIPVVPDLARFELVDASVATLQNLVDGSSLDLNGLSSGFNFTAVPANTVDAGSVSFSITGCAALNRIENNPPYTAEQENTGFVDLQIGACTITATPHSLPNGGGDAGTPLSVSFNVVDSTPVNNAGVNPVIKASRTSCASPCTVVFSAEDTIAAGLNEHEVWALLSYYWDFDTDEADTYGSLYNQNYTYTAGDTAYEAGHVPMVTKTFLCEVGTCIYNVGLQARDVGGNSGDVYQLIAVKSESDQWGSANTICVSNSLSISDNWTGYDKPCPSGATKRNIMPEWDKYDNKLVLLKKGDVFRQDYVATHLSQGNYKIGYFGDNGESKPEIYADLRLGATRIAGPSHAPLSANTLRMSNNDLIEMGGFPENITVEGIRVPNVRFPMSYQHVGVHDLDMNYEGSDSNDHGAISITSSPAVCHDFAVNASNYPDLDCENVPFAKGGYVSAVDIVGGGAVGPSINLGETQCGMVNYFGIVDTSIRKTAEHNVRIAGWYRLNIMRSFFRGEHDLPGKQKLTLRGCVLSGGNWNVDGRLWIDSPYIASTWQDDVDGRARSDASTTHLTDVSLGGDGSDRGEPYLHQSRYQVVAFNQLGDNGGPVGNRVGGTPYQTNSAEHNVILFSDIMISHNIIEREPGVTSNGDIQLNAINSACVDNDYWNQPRGSEVACFSGWDVDEWNIFREPTPTPIPAAPGS